MDEEYVLFPPQVLDRISADWALAWALRGGNDLLAHYIFRGFPTPKGRESGNRRGLRDAA